MGNNNWLQLTSGGGYDFDTKKIFGRFTMEQDLAWPMAGVNRYVRHTAANWPVAIHSVAVARCIEQYLKKQEAFSPEHVLNGAAAALLHDAHEAVIGDIPTPLARELGKDKVEEIKLDVQLAIEHELHIPLARCPSHHPDLIRQADLAALMVEKQLLMPPEPRPWCVPVPGPEWMQPMYDVVTAIIRAGEQQDGGQKAFIAEYKRLVAR
jgi:hypothetical protein